MLVRLGGTVVTMRAIGPANYGIFSAAAAFILFASTLAQMGLEVFLIRKPEAPTRRDYDEAFTFLLLASVVVSVVGLALTIPLGGLLRPRGMLLPLRVLLLLVPINVLWAPAQACIERQFGYRRMGILELGGDAVLYATAVPLAIGGLGSWSLVAGYFAWQTWLLIGSYAFAGLRPHLAWSWSGAREMVGHGFTYSLSTWATSAGNVVVAVVVGTFAGPVGVGYVNFSIRLAGMLNFTRRGVFRVGMVAVSRARNGGLARLARALEEGMFLVMIAAAAPFAAFGLVARGLIPPVFGSSWDPALHLYVAFSIVSVLGVVNLVQCTVLFAVGKNMSVARASLWQFAILSVAAVALVPVAGILGIAIASGLSLASTVVTHRATARIAPMRYRRLLLPLAVLVPPMLAPLVSFPRSLLTLVPAVVALAFPATRRELRFVVGLLRTTLRGHTDATAPVAAIALAAPLGPVAVDADAAWGSEAEMAMALAPTLAAPAVPAAPAPAAPPSLAPPTLGGGDAGLLFAGTGDLGSLGAMSLAGAGAMSLAGAGAMSLAGAGGMDDYWLLPPDAVTGAASMEVLMARAGRLLGGARRTGWPLMLAAVELTATSGGSVSEATLRAVADTLRADLRFDDPVARAAPATFVLATALVPGGADAEEVAAHLSASVAAAAATAGEPARMRWSSVVATATSAEEVDDLLRRVVEQLHAR